MAADDEEVGRAMTAPLEYLLATLRGLLRAPLLRYGATMFARGRRYERARLQARSMQTPLAREAAPTVPVDPAALPTDPDATRPARPARLPGMVGERVVPSGRRDPRKD